MILCHKMSAFLVRKGLELAELRHERGSGAAPEIENKRPCAGPFHEIGEPHLTF